MAFFYLNARVMISSSSFQTGNSILMGFDWEIFGLAGLIFTGFNFFGWIWFVGEWICRDFVFSGFVFFGIWFVGI
jgi:hypothetical protein